MDGLSEWVQDPTRPDTTLSWHLISGKLVTEVLNMIVFFILSIPVWDHSHFTSFYFLADSGFIEQDITKSSSYYIAVGNVYLNEVKVIAEAAYDVICFNFDL